MTAVSKTTEQKRGARASAAPSFRALYADVAIPALKEKLSRTNVLSLPRIHHVVVAAGVGKHAKDGKFVEHVEQGLALLTGQKPARRYARKSISGFKLRQGQLAGFVVTLRGAHMENFLRKFIHVTLPRVRDFRGIPTRNIDANGNLSIGIREAQAFPEVDPQTIETLFGLQVTVVTTARSKEEARALFESLRFPLTEETHERVAAVGPQRKAKKKS